jgi:selenocysteine lyase/cysteine desulfurase
VVCLSVPDGDAVKRRLVERRMICSFRSALRVAPHIYNTIDEVDGFMDALELELRQVGS